MSDHGVKYSKLVSTGMHCMPCPAPWHYAVCHISKSCRADAQVTGHERCLRKSKRRMVVVLCFVLLVVEAERYGENCHLSVLPGTCKHLCPGLCLSGFYCLQSLAQYPAFRSEETFESVFGNRCTQECA